MNDEEKTLNKEEILAKSREENKNGDEREKHALYTAAYTATMIGFLLWGIISVVLSVLDRQSFEMNIVPFATIGTMYTIWGIKMTKRKAVFLVAGIVCITAAVFNLVAWILQLCGVMS